MELNKKAQLLTGLGGLHEKCEVLPFPLRLASHVSQIRFLLRTERPLKEAHESELLLLPLRRQGLPPRRQGLPPRAWMAG